LRRYFFHNKTRTVPQEEIKGRNGVSCGIYNFVSDDLPPKASRYVKIHEAIHYLGLMDETKTNFLAASKEPIGFIQTILHSLTSGLKTTKLSNLPCQAGGVWNIFKVYFLASKTY